MTTIPMRLRTAIAATAAAVVLLGTPAAAAGPSDGDLVDLPRSTDDRGFSILLMSPTDLFLTGRHMLRIEAIIPRGDAIAQVDFFLDGRLLATDRHEPYETPAEFGQDIRRHTIEIRATTRDGRRAKVSLLTRSGDIAEGATGRIVPVPVVVRLPSGAFADDLGVSDFVLMEDGAARPIIYFTPGPFPASIAVVMEPGLAGDPDLAAPLSEFLRGLPDHHSTALVDGPFANQEAATAAFSFDPAALETRLALGAGASAAGVALEDRIHAASDALGARRGLRVLLVLVRSDGAAQGADLLEEPVAPALEAALAIGVVVYAAVIGPPGEASSAADALRDAAGRSGGEIFAVPATAALGNALGATGADLRHRYVLGYTPAEEDRTGWRAIQVRLRAREAAIRAPRSIYLR